MDWRAITGNSLWILGLSVLMAACSYSNWRAAALHRSRREVFTAPLFRAFSSLGLVLILVGWGIARADRWWEMAICITMALRFAWVLGRLMQLRWLGPYGGS
jgi:hypothetical protein